MWFALLLQLVQALLGTVADVNRGDLADDDTDDSAGAGRGAPAAWIDAGALLLLLLLVNARIARAEERTAEEATRAAVAATARRAVVVRDGEPRDVDAGEIVPGDVVVVDVGDAAPADCRLLDASSAIVEVDVTALANVGVRDGDIDGVPVAETGEDAFLARVPCRRGAVRRLVLGRAPRRRGDHARGSARVVIRTGAKTAIGERARPALFAERDARTRTRMRIRPRRRLTARCVRRLAAYFSPPRRRAGWYSRRFSSRVASVHTRVRRVKDRTRDHARHHTRTPTRTPTRTSSPSRRLSRR